MFGVDAAERDGLRPACGSCDLVQTVDLHGTASCYPEPEQNWRMDEAFMTHRRA